MEGLRGDLQILRGNGPKCLGHTASDFEAISSEELRGVDLTPEHKGFGVPALYKNSSSYREGLRPGDIILFLDSRSFESLAAFNTYIRTKLDPAVTIEFLRDGKVEELKTKLDAEEDFLGICHTFEELREEADFGDPYALLQARRSLRNMHWDFIGLGQLPEAQQTAEVSHRPLLVGLFGSAVCCVHLAPWTAPYKDIMTHSSVQRTLSDDYVSTLVVKPEAYSLYRRYDIDSRFPALLQMTEGSELKAYFEVRPDTSVSSLRRFLQLSEP